MTDWATRKAIEILRDLRGANYEQSAMFLATELRLARQIGVMDGTKQASKIIDEVFGGQQRVAKAS